MSQENSRNVTLSPQDQHNQSSMYSSPQHSVDCVALPLDDHQDETESPPAISLFLCHSNLSALLETATGLSLGITSGEPGGRTVCEGPRAREGCNVAETQQSSRRCVCIVLINSVLAFTVVYQHSA